MMENIAIAFLLVGVLLIASAVVIYFRTDCRSIMQELREARRITMDDPHGRRKNKNERTEFAHLDRPSQTKQENEMWSGRNRFIRGAAQKAQDDTAFLAAFPVSEQKQTDCDTVPLEEADGETEELRENKKG